LLNTIFTTVVASFAVAHGTSPAAQVDGAIHGYNVACTASAIAFAVAGLLAALFIRKPANMIADDGRVNEDLKPMAVSA
jgi:hypothetical protein